MKQICNGCLLKVDFILSFSPLYTCEQIAKEQIYDILALLTSASFPNWTNTNLLGKTYL